MTWRSKTTLHRTMTLVGLLLAYMLGVQLRAHRLETSLPYPLAPFWLESAQRFRTLRFVAEGQPIPNPDVQIQWPDGFEPDRDTLVQEYVLGTLARLCRPEFLATFVRRATPYIYCLILFPLFWLNLQLTRRKWAALFAATLFLTLPPALERSTGLVIFRENFALTMYATQIAALYAHFRREKGQAFAWLSGGFLLLAHFTWKVTSFYQLFLLGYLALLTIWRSPDKKVRAAVYALTLPPLVVSLLFPVSLRIDRYWASPQATLSIALVLVCLLARAAPGWIGSPLSRTALLGGITFGLHLVLPATTSYNTAWDTLIAKIKCLGRKPDDPSLLSIHARHYWTGNYRSPSAARAVRDFALPVLLSVMAFRRIGRDNPTEDSSHEKSGLFFLFLGLAGFAAGYLLFRKFGTFLALFMTPMVALGVLTIIEQAKHRIKLAIAVLVAALGIGILASWTGLGAESALGEMHTDDDDYGLVYDTKSLDILSTWISEHTSEQDVFLASWPLSPYLATYLNRRTNLHAFFEWSVPVERFEEFNERLFGPLEELYAFARQYQSTYLVYEANFLLRTDRWMSYRYVADHMKINGLEAAYRLHYTPDDTPGFQLVYQNAFFRIYRVLPDSAARVAISTFDYAPLFDPALPGAQPGQPLEAGPALLYGTLEAGRWLRVGQDLENKGKPGEALNAYRSAIQAGPYAVDAYAQLIRTLVRHGELHAARQAADLARSRFDDKAGMPPIPVATPDSEGRPPPNPVAPPNPDVAIPESIP